MCDGDLIIQMPQGPKPASVELRIGARAPAGESASEKSTKLLFFSQPITLAD
jgi:hypothetical protein